MHLGTTISYPETERRSGVDAGNGKIDKWVVAMGMDQCVPNILRLNHQKVLSYINAQCNKVKVKRKVPVIGARGIGLDVSEYLLYHDNVDKHNKRPDKGNVHKFFINWGVDKSNHKRAGLLPDEEVWVTKPYSDQLS